MHFLVEERDVIGFGTETVGTDAGQAFGFEPAFPCHTFMHGAGKFGLASLNALDQLPATGAHPHHGRLSRSNTAPAAPAGCWPWSQA